MPGLRAEAKEKGKTEMRIRKIFNGLLGLAVGVCSLPLAPIVWPAFCAWYLWNETDDD